MTTADAMTTRTVEDCPRCGDTHEDLIVRELERAIEFDQGRARTWSTCPTNDEPIVYIDQKRRRSLPYLSEQIGRQMDREFLDKFGSDTP